MYLRWCFCSVHDRCDTERATCDRHCEPGHQTRGPSAAQRNPYSDGRCADDRKARSCFRPSAVSSAGCTQPQQLALWLVLALGLVLALVLALWLGRFLEFGGQFVHPTLTCFVSVEVVADEGAA